MKRKLLISTLSGLAMLTMLIVPAFAHDGVGGDELAAADSMFIVAMIFALMTGLMIILSWRNGEFRNPEAIKRQALEMSLLEDDEDVSEYAITEA